MSTVIKRSEGAIMRQECPYGCCTPVHGKNVKQIRRTLKRRERQTWRREVRGSDYS